MEKPMDSMNIGVLLGSTREGRKGAAVAEWVLEAVAERPARYALIDLADHPMPHLNEPIPPAAGRYTHDHTKAWASHIHGFDAFVIVTPEYNHQIPAVLKNALDHVFAEWAHKPVGFVGYGVVGGARALDQLRVLSGVLGMLDVQPQVELSVLTDFEGATVAREGRHVTALAKVLDAVEGWAPLARTYRESRG
jgi:NAD(P)H-dependent FMN reductase